MSLLEVKSWTSAEWGPPLRAELSFLSIAEAVQQVMESGPEAGPFIPGVTRVPLNVPTYGAPEVVEALDSLMSGWVTMGKKVKRFEEMWAEYIGVEHAVMVNSGSSANLLALSCLGLKPGDEVITPALTWATTVFPIAQVGAVPVLVDVDLDTYNVSVEAAEQAITPRTRAIMPVDLLGNPVEFYSLRQLGVLYNLRIVEDACEAHGATYDGFKAGLNADISTFSFFFSHHISTIEGGIVVTSNKELAERCRSMRAFGWAREMRDYSEMDRVFPHIDPRFLFLNAGYNFRPTEIQGAFGIHQLPRLEGLIAHRRENAAYWNRELAQFDDYLQLQHEQPRVRHVWFAYPVMVKPGAPFTKQELANHLEARGVETRPIEAGNMAIQPAMKNIQHRVSGSLRNAQYIHENAFFFGNHQGIGAVEREAIVGYFKEFFDARVSHRLRRVSGEARVPGAPDSRT